VTKVEISVRFAKWTHTVLNERFVEIVMFSKSFTRKPNNTRIVLFDGLLKSDSTLIRRSGEGDVALQKEKVTTTE
jgi:hypothetical protein